MTAPAEYYKIGSWDSQGLPNYLATTETVNPDLIQRIRTSFPETKPVDVYNNQYLTTTSPRNLIIKTNDSNFTGTDVWVTFIHEGAGYRNVFGYYVYPLQGDNLVPTKLVEGVYVPMSYSDRDSVDGSGKSVLKKTIVFPNASLKGSGGSMLPGHKVKLLYDTSNSSTKFPNNTGIGFFVIPNGWNGSSVTNAGARVHSDKVFNSNNYEQTVILNDLENSDTDFASIILGIEDIMRPAGDRDFNDLVVKITASSPSSVLLSDILTLSNGETVVSTEPKADQTGLYIQIPDATLTSLRNTSSGNKLKIKHKIKIKAIQKHHRENFKKIFRNLVLPNGGVFDENESEFFDESGDPLDIIIRYVKDKSDLDKFLYLLKSGDNKLTMSEIDTQVRNLVDYQNFYIFDNYGAIESQNIKLSSSSNGDYDDSVGDTTNVLITDAPTTRNMSGPLAMGDPHVLNIRNQQVYLPDKPKVYELYNDGETKIYTKLETYPENEKYIRYANLYFMRYIIIMRDSKKCIMDMFNRGVYYDSDMNECDKPEWITKEPINITYQKRIDKYTRLHGNLSVDYISFYTHNLGRLTLELLYVPERCDFVSGMSLLSQNLLFVNGKGALLNGVYETYDNIYDLFVHDNCLYGS